jgi:hypothetical protein
MNGEMIRARLQGEFAQDADNGAGDDPAGNDASQKDGSHCNFSLKVLQLKFGS